MRGDLFSVEGEKERTTSMGDWRVDSMKISLINWGSICPIKKVSNGRFGGVNSSKRKIIITEKLHLAVFLCLSSDIGDSSTHKQMTTIIDSIAFSSFSRRSPTSDFVEILTARARQYLPGEKTLSKFNDKSSRKMDLFSSPLLARNNDVSRIHRCKLIWHRSMKYSKRRSEKGNDYVRQFIYMQMRVLCLPFFSFVVVFSS